MVVVVSGLGGRRQQRSGAGICQRVAEEIQQRERTLGSPQRLREDRRSAVVELNIRKDGAQRGRGGEIA